MLSIEPIKAFNDNYLWVIFNSDSRKSVVVDPGDPEPVEAYLEQHSLELEGILITHHHADHTGGIAKLTEGKNIPVYGPDSNRISGITHTLEDGDKLDILGSSFQIIAVPGHTLDHIAYFAPDQDSQGPLLFCGDTLFAGGCGRVFEGTHEMMYQSLSSLSSLPSETRVYCAHEYTLANLEFAHAVSPNDTILNQRIINEKAKRASNTPTVPTSIGVELATNPFLRCNDTGIVQSAESHTGISLTNPAQVFAVLRQWKDTF